jgi:hypothetical protein
MSITSSTQYASGPVPAGMSARFGLPGIAREGIRRGPHPADILYWIACAGGVCLLLLVSI